MMCLAVAAVAAATFGGAAAAGDTVYIDGKPYEDRGVVTLPAGSSGAGTFLGIQVATGSHACKPSGYPTTIRQPSAHVYYGLTDSIYEWDFGAEADSTGCPDNRLHLDLHVTDIAFDGSSPVMDMSTSGDGRGHVVASLHMTQHYSNASMAARTSYHQITATARGVDDSAKATWCTSTTWTYLATPFGPQYVDSQDQSCGS
jgi:hypothetical protein